MGKTLNIAVAGAGISGLAVSTLLARAGHQVHIFDQFDTPQPIGSGLMLQKTGLAVLDKLGLRSKVDALGSPIHRLWGLTTPSMRAVLDVRYTKLDKALYGLGIQRAMLFDVLLKAATEAGADITQGVRISAADESSGTLSAEIGAPQTSFDLIIDALGVKSPLTTPPRKELTYGALWATLPWPDGDTFNKTALEQRYLAARQMAGVMPSGRASADSYESLTYFWSIKASEEQAWRATPLPLWKEQAAALWPDTRSLLDQFASHDQLTFARYRHRTHRRPVSGPRLVHIGDAWHAASPQLGQGANMALLDAWALARALQEELSIADALQTYRKSRTGHVRLYQLMSWLFTPVYQGDSRALPFLRDWLAAPVSRIPPAPQFLAAMVSGAVGSPLKKLGLRE